ncbi:MAG: dicarboxylate/amino acid:cation symporter [Alphaproteobacteria bacterium]
MANSETKRRLWLRLLIGIAAGLPVALLLMNETGMIAGRPAAAVAADALTLIAVPLLLLVLTYFKLKLWARVLIALALGIGFGLLWQEGAIALEPIGDIFINLIKMLIVPLILTTLVAGVASMGHPATMGRLGLKAFGLYLVTTAFAIMIGLSFGVLFEPGVGLSIEGVEPRAAAAEGKSLVDRLVELVPTNPVEALASANVLQIILFALLLGVGIVVAGEPGRPLKEFFHSASEVMLRITRFVMEVAPFGVFALVGVVAATYGLDVLESLAKLILVVYAACLTHIVVVYWGLIRFVANLPVIRFIRGVFDAQAVAYSTASSSATLPVTITVARDNLGVDKSTSGFVLPLGATINMDGTALYLGILAVFAAQIFNVDLSMADYGAIVLTATLASIGSAGIPSASLVLMSIVLSSVGFSGEQIGIVLAMIFGVDRVMDMMRTLTNITGDSMVSVLVSKSENALDEETYRTPAVR